MMKSVGILLVLALSLANTSQATVEMLKNGELKLCEFAPKNDIRIPAGLEDASGISEEDFNAVMSQFETVYAPIVKAAGGTLVLNRLWTTDEANSNATRKGKKWIINAYGGLARYKNMDKDGEMMVLCHEMGHHMGGFPEYPGSFGKASWAANEGQADYFATMKCFRRMIQNDNNGALMANLKLPKEIVAGCQKGFSNAKDISICERSALTGKLLGEILHDLGQETSPSPDFNTPDKTKVAKTNNEHPASQCRLDTYFSGATCAADMNVDFSRSEPKLGACAKEAGATYGFRNECWYKTQARL